MATKEVVFSDRIVGLSLHNGLVRIDLATFGGQAKNKDGKEGVRMDITHQLVMPLDAFVAGVGAQQKLVQEVVSRREQLAAKSKPDAAAAEAAPEAAKA
jgi:hypothetical protein